MIELEFKSEDNAFFKRKKKSVMSKYRPTNAASIDSATELAVYLIAHGRVNEARALLGSYCELSPYDENRPERWVAVGQAILLLAYLMRESGDIENNSRLLSLVKQHDYNPVPLSNDERLLPRLLEAELTDEIMHGQMSNVEKIQSIAQTCLLFIYSLEMLTFKEGELGATDESTIRREIVKCLDELKSLTG